MNGPHRKANASAEATQALSALDIIDVQPIRKGSEWVEATQALSALDVIEVEPVAGDDDSVPGVRASVTSSPSMAPVGLDLRPEQGLDEETDSTMPVRLPIRRSRLRGIVIGALGTSLVILLAAAIERVGGGAHQVGPLGQGAHAAPPSTATVPAATAAASPPPAPDRATAAAAAQPAVANPRGDTASTGTVRVAAPSAAGHVWLDGKKLSSPSMVVSCGTHQIKVGARKAHSIDVPCNGEVAVSK
jgi:hypothetical protein